MPQNLTAAIFFLLAASAVQLLWPLLRNTSAGRLTLRRILKICVRSLLSFFGYLLIGAALPYLRPLQLSEDALQAIDPASFYGDRPNGQRAALLTDNVQALEMRLRLIDQARESIVLTTFSLHADDSGTDLCALLLEAADRGVRVDILTDGYDAMTDNEGKPPFAQLAAHENISFRVYSPPSVLHPGKAMARMHEKCLLVDSQYLLLGGRNSHDYFLGDYPAKLHNLDLDLLLCGHGDVTDALYARYNEILALEDCVFLTPDPDPVQVETVYAELRAHAAGLRERMPQAFAPYDYAANTHPVNKATLISSPVSPTAKEPVVWHTLTQLMGSARKEALVHTPYLICSRTMREELADIARRTDLRITLNAPETSANLFGAAVYQNDRRKLLDTGVQLLEYHGSRSSHTKALCIDERLAIVGSFNFDLRSVYVNSEILLALDCPKLARELKTFMTAVEQYAAPAAAPAVIETTHLRDLLVLLLRLVERPVRFLL